MPKLLEAPDIYGYSIFCDDIRVEIDGKLTFVGSYGGRMYVNAPFPVTLPKFAISVIFQQAKELFIPNLGIWIFLPGDSDDHPSIQGVFTEHSEGATLKHLEQAPQLPSDIPARYVGITSNMTLQNLVLKEAGTLSVRVLRGDDLHRVGRLAVLQGVLPPPPPS
jgi:hypothetical protein